MTDHRTKKRPGDLRLSVDGDHRERPQRPPLSARRRRPTGANESAHRGHGHGVEFVDRAEVRCRQHRGRALDHRSRFGCDRSQDLRVFAPTSVCRRPRSTAIRAQGDATAVHAGARRSRMRSRLIQRVDVAEILLPVPVDVRRAVGILARRRRPCRAPNVSIITGKNMYIGLRIAGAPDVKYTAIIPSAATSMATGNSRASGFTGVSCRDLRWRFHGNATVCHRRHRQSRFANERPSNNGRCDRRFRSIPNRENRRGYVPARRVTVTAQVSRGDRCQIRCAD